MRDNEMQRYGWSMARVGEWIGPLPLERHVRSHPQATAAVALCVFVLAHERDIEPGDVPAAAARYAIQPRWELRDHLVHGFYEMGLVSRYIDGRYEVGATNGALRDLADLTTLTELTPDEPAPQPVVEADGVRYRLPLLEAVTAAIPMLDAVLIDQFGGTHWGSPVEITTGEHAGQRGTITSVNWAVDDDRREIAPATPSSYEITLAPSGHAISRVAPEDFIESGLGEFASLG